jgi:hypothetical protein
LRNTGPAEEFFPERRSRFSARRCEDAVMTRVRVLAFGLLVAVAVSSAGAAVRQPLVIRADEQLAGFHIDGRLGDAVRIFGKPDSMRWAPGEVVECDVSWPQIGLVMRFLGNPCTNRSMFVRATATGKRWQTIRKLRIGDAVARLRLLYPGIHPTRAGGGSALWPIFQRQQDPGANMSPSTPAGLTARTSHGRVVALIVTASSFTITIP